MRRACSLLVAVLVLAGCTATATVQGQTDNGDETFKGTAVGGLDGSGTIDLTSSKGKRCTGTFVYVTQRNGEGTFQCNTGQGGAFKFVSTGTRGTGTGSIAGRAFTFSFSP